jgi:hypothetical protein
VNAGQWPSPESLLEDLIAALNRGAENEPDPEKTNAEAGRRPLGRAAVQDPLSGIFERSFVGRCLTRRDRSRQVRSPG